MAIYTGLTSEQMSTLEYLFNRAKSIKRRMQNGTGKLIDSPDILEQELSGIQKQINEVFAARDTYEFHIKRAAEHIEEAEKLKQEWGF